MQVRRDAAWTAFDEAMEQIEGATRLKDIRDATIIFGRATVTLFERAPEGDRPHPRLRMAFTDIVDPSPPSLPAPEDWSDAAEFRGWLTAALGDPQLLDGLDQPPGQSPRYWQNVLRAGRITAVLEHARAALERRDGWPASELDAARYALAELGAQAYAGDIHFDDEDTGTYHSFLFDQPFVHVLERLRVSLPKEGSPAFALLPAEQQYAVRRQDEQLTNHLDFLMRFKYAYYGILEADIERSLGGFLIDRETRLIASEDPASLDTLVPRYQLLRIDPTGEHPLAGAWVMRTPEGITLYDGTPVEVEEEQLRATPVGAGQLTFTRAPNHSGLRRGLRFDWNGDGWIDTRPIPWVLWAGHCDVKAVLEQIGLTMLEQPSVFEYRSDTGALSELTRDLLLELLTSVTEFGSVYLRLDGSGEIRRGIQRFGGARNDNLPDRLQFDGVGPGQHLRWPFSLEREALQVTELREDGELLDLDAAFAQCHADPNQVDFSPNPRYLGTVDGDYNLIDASGMVLTASIRAARFDEDGQLVREDQSVEIDLRPEAGGRSFLGTALFDAGAREIYRVYLDHDQPAIVSELWRWDLDTRAEVHVREDDVVVPLASPLSTTVSREMRIDDPAAFQALIEIALQRGQNICADTDWTQPVWNGVVTRMQAERVAVNEAARVERWRVAFTARFGEATLDFMVRREPDGTPAAYCPVPSVGTTMPDFLWQDLPDVASKGIEQGDWVVNRAMVERGIVEAHREEGEQGGWYVYDDHVKNAFELLYAALAGYRYTIVHQNKRYVFEDEAAWTAARAQLDALRDKVRYE
ncbi:MAG: hypothetical protein R6X02_16965 [Enhygromyxa sp.]